MEVFHDRFPIVEANRSGCRRSSFSNAFGGDPASFIAQCRSGDEKTGFPPE